MNSLKKLQTIKIYFKLIENIPQYRFARLGGRKTKFESKKTEQEVENDIQDDIQFTEKQPMTWKEKKVFKAQQLQEEYENSIKKSPYEIYEESNVDIQYKILQTEEINDLYQIYHLNKLEFNMVNYSTVYHRIIKKQLSQHDLTIEENRLFQENPKQFKLKRIESLLENKDFIEIMTHMKQNMGQMDAFSFSNFISNLAKLNIYDKDIILKATQQTDFSKFNLKAVSYLLWALQKFEIKDENFLKFSEKFILQQQKTLDQKSLSNIFYSLAVLGSKNDAVKLNLENQIIDIAQTFDSTSINLVVQVYDKYKRVQNQIVLDALTQRFMTIINQHSMRNIANMVTYCANLDYLNYNLFNTIESELLRRLEPLLEEDQNPQEPQGENMVQESTQVDDPEIVLQQFLKEQEDYEQTIQEKSEQKLQQEQQNDILGENQNDLLNTHNVSPVELSPEFYQNETKKLKKTVPEDKKIYDIKPRDASSILVGFCKLRIIKPKLFEILEYNFIKRIDQANASTIITYAFAHSSLCTQMLMNFNSQKKTYLRRSIKHLKKYNHNFYEIVCQKAMKRIDEFKVEELLSLLTSASRPLVKKRAICRQLVQLGVEGVPKLTELSKNMPENIAERKQYEYFRLLSNFAFQNLQRDKIIEAYNKNNINIEELMKNHGYIAPKVSTDALPQFSVKDIDWEDDEELPEQQQQKKE